MLPSPSSPRILATLFLCVGLSGSTVDGLALAGVYDGGSASSTEAIVEVVSNSATGVRLASRTDAESPASSTLLFNDFAEVTTLRRLRTPPQFSGTWRIRMLNARRAQTGRSK